MLSYKRNRAVRRYVCVPNAVAREEEMCLEGGDKPRVPDAPWAGVIAPLGAPFAPLSWFCPLSRLATDTEARTELGSATQQWDATAGVAAKPEFASQGMELLEEQQP